MIVFLLKGLLRDRQRSFFPILMITIGVLLTVLTHCWINGILGDIVNLNARFITGHVRIMTRAYAENEDQLPNDLALVGINELVEKLQEEFPEMVWVKRIHFGGLLDVPDEKGETKAQGPTAGLAVDLLAGKSTETDRLDIEKSIVHGYLPHKPGEILISEEFAMRLGVNIGNMVTLLSSTMYGSMAMQNFTIAGTVRFGVGAIDRSAIIADISDAQLALDMNDASGEILGYFKNNLYNDVKAEEIAKQFNTRYTNSDDEFAPVMFRLKEQKDLASYLDYSSTFKSIIVFVFVLAMSIVLWNAGLIGGLRRYGEVGVRLAIGEHNGHIYRSMIYESVLIGIFGSVFGSLIGLGIAYILQTKGIDFSSFFKNATMMVPVVFRAHITPEAYYIGFLPGLFSTVLGTMLSGIGIYKRKTAQLFREMEA